MSSSLFGSNETRTSPLLKPPEQGAMPPPCQPPDCCAANEVGHENGSFCSWKRIRPQSTSPNAATTLLMPSVTWKRRESSGWLSPHEPFAQVAHAWSAPGHSVVPSPPVN